MKKQHQRKNARERSSIAQYEAEKNGEKVKSEMRINWKFKTWRGKKEIFAFGSLKI